jgi:5-formyltetrahydrofolate cyclo-ligase
MNMPDPIKRWRAQQRAELLARRMAIPQAQRRQWDTAITALLLQGFPMLRGAVVGIYWPIKGEFDPRFALRRLRASGARAALPVVVRKGAPLEFRAWWPGVATTKGVYELPIPCATELLRPDALLIPPIGFDAMGYRLGYGGGFYDRTLAAMSPQPLKIGVAFELSRIATIEPQPHDIAMDYVVTEQGIYRVGCNGLERLA